MKYHAAAPERLDGMSLANAALWAMAALLAMTAHAGAAWWMLRQPVDEVAIAGAAEMVIDVALLGTAPADQVSAGEAVQPVENNEAETVDAAELMQPDAVRPVELSPVEPVRPPQPVEALPAEAQPVAPIEPSPPSDVQIAAVQPLEAAVAPVEQAQAVDTLETVEEAVPLPDVAPVPEPRPQPVRAETTLLPKKAEPRKPEPRKPEPKKKPEQVVQKKAAAPRAGAGGRNEADARKGDADGQENARAASRDAAGNSRQAGNAAVSNYPGKVLQKLRRALPRRSSGKGEVYISFRVSANGSVGSIRIARSSGSPALDSAALETVRRAAPFPPIPAEAGRSSWDFDLPLTFKR